MARVLLRSVMQEHFNRILREDMLSACNHIASLNAIECSIILHGSSLISSSNNGDALIKKATGVLEIITGQAPTRIKVDPRVVDPQTAGMSEGQFQAEDKAVAGAIMERMKKVKKTSNNSSTKGKKQPTSLAKQKLNMAKKKEKEFARVQDTEFKAAKAATQVKVDLHGPRMWYLMDKLREFYLPDVSQFSGEDTSLNLAKLGRGHDLNMERKHIAGRFGVWVRGFPSIPLRPISQDENPVTAFTTYSIPCLDLMKFPDIESHYEQLGSLENLNLILRPTLQVTTPVPKYLQKAPFFAHIDKILLMQWLLGQMFNPFMPRPYQKALPPEQLFYRDIPEWMFNEEYVKGEEER